jgi:hypothetical protein
MQLKELAALFVSSRIEGDGNVSLSGIKMDSREVDP